ncbi:MAG: lipoate--protein ligase, partial [Marinilabiliales bacterium]|nr:lipoate--protein ligase [Marinilabiliales bacterium]
MKLLISDCHDPYFNLAAEEVLLKETTHDLIFLYSNNPCVVVGKHQITNKEINFPFVATHNIQIARRLSGGGAVYHDPGNLNFSVISTLESVETFQASAALEPLISFLGTQGIYPERSERNDLLVNGGKISGNASHVYKNRSLTHYTLLINSDLNILSQVLKGHPERFTDKSVASNRTRVTSLSIALPGTTPHQLQADFTTYFLSERKAILTDFAENGLKARIWHLAKEKYASIDWIFSYSPKYIYRNSLEWKGVLLPFSLTVERNCISRAIIESDIKIDEDIKLIFNSLLNRQFILNQFSEPLQYLNNSPLGRQLLAS